MSQQKDILYLKSTGKIHIVRDNLIEGEGVVHLGGTVEPICPSYPIQSAWTGVFFNDGSYAVAKEVEVEDEVLENPHHYVYNAKTQEVTIHPLYATNADKGVTSILDAGVAEQLKQLQQKVEQFDSRITQADTKAQGAKTKADGNEGKITKLEGRVTALEALPASADPKAASPKK